MIKNYDTEVPEEPPCPDCKGRGWLHMTSGLRGREIQRCDSCRVYATGEEATEAHTKGCGCTWAEAVEELPE